MNYKQKVLQVYLTIQIFILIGLLMPANVISQTQDKKLTAREIAQQTLPSTVSIVMVNDKTDEIKSGSGFFVAEDIVVTNYHVIENTNKGIAKIVGEDKIYEVLGTVGTDEKNDLALLKLKGVKGKPLKLNNDDKTAIGDDVYAVGNPQGLEGTFSQGIVSSIRNNDKLNLLQITASISQGSSGGAVLNDKGEVVGVAVGAIEGGQSLNFAIPISFLRSLLSQQTSLAKLNNESSIFDKQTQPNSKKITKSPINVVPKESIPRKANRMQFKTSDLIEENLSGKIKAIKESIYIPEKKFDEWILGKPISVSTLRYNLEGNRESVEKLVNGIEPHDYWVLFLIYNDRELPLIEKTLYYYNYSNGFVTWETFLKCKNCSTFEFERKILIKYENGEQTRFNSGGKIFWKQITNKEEKGKIVIKTYDGDGNLTERQLLYKNSMGDIVETWNQTILTKKVTVEQKDKLKETTTSVEDAKEIVFNIEYFDKAKKLILRSESGLAVEKYEYEFDSKDNWIKQTEFEQVKKFGKTYFEPRKVKTREIVYY